jgi:hypothetical protein
VPSGYGFVLGSDSTNVTHVYLASLSASQTNGLLAASVAEPAALTNGYQLSFAIGAGLVLVALVVAGTVLRPAEEAEEEVLQERDRPLGDAA